jgi:molecular chaperone DnaK
MCPAPALVPDERILVVPGGAMDSKQVFGIDLGTTYSCIAVIDELSGKPYVLVNAEGDVTTPSVVYFHDAETRVVGKEAKNTAVLEPDRVVAMVKREIGVPDWRWFFEDEEYSAEEISAYILRKVVDDAEQQLGFRPEDVVITCPAYFGIPERDATAAAGRIAGLHVLEVINEPTAAAIAYGLQNDRDQVVLVYDLGGGTFDVSIIEVKDGSVTVVATGGDHQLGGRDWDEEVVKYLASEWAAQTGSDDDPTESSETLQDLWRRAEEAKRSLSTRTETRIPVSHGGRPATITLTREKFDELTRHLLENTLSLTRDTLGIARQLGHADVDKLLLVGGSTRMPQVTDRLRQELGKEPQVHDPDQAVAKGAAIYGQKLAIGRRITTEIARELGTTPDQVDTTVVTPQVKARAQEAVAAELGMRLPALKRLDDMKVTNVASHSFGIVALRKAGAGLEEYISNLVLAQSPLPAVQTRQYATVEANQADVHLRIMESALREPDIDDFEQVTEVGDAVLLMAPGLPEGAPVEVTFALNQQGRLIITGRDLADDGKSVTATIETNRVLSDEEVDRAATRTRGLKVTG